MDKVLEKCEHRFEVTFSFTVLGFGRTKKEATEDARRFGINYWINFNSAKDYKVAKVVKGKSSFTRCLYCLEEKKEKWKQEQILKLKLLQEKYEEK